MKIFSMISFRKPSGFFAIGVFLSAAFATNDIIVFFRILEANPESPQFAEGYEYLWQIARKDGRPVDTSVVARRIEIVSPSDGGLELKLIGLKSSAVGLEAKCYILNKTDATNPEFVDLPSGDNTVKFVDPKPTPPGEKTPFADFGTSNPFFLFKTT